MEITKSVKLEHGWDATSTILSDPRFVIPRMFPVVKELTVNGSEFVGKGRYAMRDFEMSGTVFKGVDIRYVFQIKSGGIGTGKLVFTQNGDTLILKFEYEGVFERTFSLMSRDRWINGFLEKLNEEIRLERIKRKI
ncbi:hypothetical protein L3N51_01425 [Metallosphaera sp. J1]|uniref:DUF3211 domain-containing protein n=1 Tax=Metallosphaera javensis (ex Hofmann et al. 2022) TaxID=99938 RepID=UPI001EE139AF|nr:DUF3211 domain-containing protein [Metallosphaera javensis (ex Hofmann et al. 2022)]MCG3109135.1 hypothetical protein [Metallosphaera javensis (ex Hofmann et al. 2022)]